MTQFKLIGRATQFLLMRRFTNKAGIDCVYGVTPDGKKCTVARFVDVEAV